jgi:2-iminobutanoate/2-iminopropanoate deaminase
MVIMQKDISRHKPTFAVITMVFLLTNSLANGTRQMRVIPGPKGLPYSDGIVVGKTLYIAGQQGRDEHDHLKAGGIGPETQAALEDLARVVKAAGFDLKDVVSVTVYLVDIRELDDSNKVYRDFMPDPSPLVQSCRSVV